MKSCSSNGGAAYSRPVRALVGNAREVWLRTRRGGLMERWVYLHRFALVLCASLCFSITSHGSAGPEAVALPEIRAAQATLPPQANTPQSLGSTSKTAEQARTEQYTLSHDRQAKAMAYSRAGYTLYFVSYFLGGLYLFLILRLGWAAKFRDIAENASDKKWIQGLVFVPLLFLTIDVLKLPVHLIWHSLSLHYQQSVQGWGSWFWDWSKGELLDIALGIVLVLILFAVMRRSPRRWWLYFWFPAVLILLGLIVVTPLIIDPLFNKFEPLRDRKSTRLNSSHLVISYAVFCLKKKKKNALYSDAYNPVSWIFHNVYEPGGSRMCECPHVAEPQPLRRTLPSGPLLTAVAQRPVR